MKKAKKEFKIRKQKKLIYKFYKNRQDPLTAHICKLIRTKKASFCGAANYYTALYHENFTCRRKLGIIIDHITDPCRSVYLEK